MSDHDDGDQPNDRTNGEANAPGRDRLTYAAAAALLGITSDAVRMKCRRRTLACETVDGRTLVVWPQPERANERRTTNGDHVRRSNADPSADATATRVTTLQAQLYRAERERDEWHAAFTEQSSRLDAALHLAATAQRLAEQERDRADQLAATVDRLRALPERTNDRTATTSVGGDDAGSGGLDPADRDPAPRRRGLRRLWPFG